MAKYRVVPEFMKVKVKPSKNGEAKKARIILIQGKDAFVIKLSRTEMMFIHDVVEDLEAQMKEESIEDGYRIED